MAGQSQTTQTPIPASTEATLQKWEEDTENPMEVQKETLRLILGRLKSLKTLRERDLDEDSALEEFVARHPITEYEYYEDAIQAVAEGRADAASIAGCDPKNELLGFKTTSGTSRGKGKLLPRTVFDQEARRSTMKILGAIMDRAGIKNKTGKKAAPYKMGRTIKTASGLIAGGATTLAFKDPHLRSMMQKSYVFPLEILDLDSSTTVSMYAHMIAMLLSYNEVGSLSSNYADQIVQLFVVLENNWQQVVHHLRSGVSLVDGLVDNHSLPILQNMVGSGNPDLADLVSKECQIGFKNIIPRLFPNCSYIAAATTGTMKPYALKLSSLAEPIPILSLLYTSSETEFGINTDPLAEVTLYTLNPRSAFFEFIPMTQNDADSQQPQTLTMDQLNIDTSYEVLITSRSGFFRYRIGDVVRVKKFEKNTPVVELLHRESVTLSLGNDRMTERHFVDAMTKAQEHCSLYFLEYTFDVDLDHVPSRYVGYCAASIDTSNGTLEELAGKLDSALATENSYYKSRRDDDLIAPIHIILVDLQGFEKYANMMLSTGTDPGQYKIPRCVTNERLRECLMNAAIKK